MPVSDDSVQQFGGPNGGGAVETSSPNQSPLTNGKRTEMVPGFPGNDVPALPQQRSPAITGARTAPRTHEQPGLLCIAAAAAMRNVFSSVRQKNIAVGVAVCGFAAAMASIPFVVRKRMT